VKTKPKKKTTAGNVFDGIKLKDKKAKRRAEIERHNHYMDGLGVTRHDPVAWAKASVKNLTATVAYQIASRASTLLNSNICFPSKVNKYNGQFYRNAAGYIKNHYKIDRKVLNDVERVFAEVGSKDEDNDKYEPMVEDV